MSVSQAGSKAKNATLTTKEDAPVQSPRPKAPSPQSPSDAVACVTFLRKIVEIRRKQSSRPG